MTRRKLTKARRALLIKLESMIGKECYNRYTQNRGGGVVISEGRQFRYSPSFRDEKGNVIEGYYSENMSDDILLGGFYHFGANELRVMKSLNDLLEYLEREHHFKI